MTDKMRLRELHRAYILAAVKAAGVSSVSALAKKMGVPDSTLTRPVKPEWKGMLRDSTLQKIWAASGLAPPGELKVAPAKKRPQPSLAYDERLMRDIVEFAAEAAQALGERLPKKELARIATTAYKINLGQSQSPDYIKKQLIQMAADAAENLEK